MYRNSEGYADPTAGAALEHIAYEERKKRRLAKKKRREAARKKATAIRREIQPTRQNEIGNEHTAWIHVWPKECKSVNYGGNK